MPFSAPSLIVALARFEITLWLTAVIPIFLPAFVNSRIMLAPVKVLPAPGGP
jgi:hypothetical protein